MFLFTTLYLYVYISILYYIAAPSNFQIIVDANTVAYISRLVNNPANLSSIAATQSILKAPFIEPMRLRTNATIDVLSPLNPELVDDNYMTYLSNIINESLTRLPSPPNASEITITHDVHLIMITILRLYPSGTFTFSENLADDTGNTPDLMCYINGILVFKGENKAQNTQMAMAKAKLDLTGKPIDMKMFDKIPFLPAVAVAGSRVEFVALHPMDSSSSKNGSNKLVTTSLSEPFNVSSIAGRIGVIKTSLQMLRVFAAVHQLLVTNTSINDSITAAPIVNNRSNGGIVTIFENCVTKECVPAPQDVYHCLARHKIPHCVTYGITKWDFVPGRFKQLATFPVGVQRLPTTEDELRAAITAVLTCMKEFHSHGFVHRDLRWPNILYNPTTMEWFVIDFELADRIGSFVPESVIADEHLPPELISTDTNSSSSSSNSNNNNAGYQAAGDIYCIGKLVKRWYEKSIQHSQSIPGDAQMWLADTMNFNPVERPTADALLTAVNSWLTKQ